MPDTVGIAGAGRMGQALGRLFHEAGQPVTHVASRHRERATAAAAFIGAGVQPTTYRELPHYTNHILIAVPDRAIGCVARALVKGGMHQGAVLHTSGARGRDALETLAAAGVSCGTLHPLQTVPSPEEGLRVLRGVTFAVDGEGEAASWAARIVEVLGGRMIHIESQARPMYHAAAVMASNSVVAVLAAAVILMKEAGVDETAARDALGPLAKTSLENVLRLGPTAALTGPVSRGDAGTVQSHLEALTKAPPAAAELYRAATRMMLQIAREQGLSETQAAALAELLKEGSQDA